MADLIKKDNFENAADFILITVPQTKPSTGRTHNVSGLKEGKTRRGNIRTGPKTGVELRFYQKDEWRKFSQEKKDECIEIRKNEIRNVTMTIRETINPK